MVTTSTAGSEVSVTGERRETTILSNGSDEDLSIVSNDARTRSQCQVDCMEPNNPPSNHFSISTPLNTYYSYA